MLDGKYEAGTAMAMEIQVVIGAKTNREGTNSALCAAITGMIPAYGLLFDENRKSRNSGRCSGRRTLQTLKKRQAADTVLVTAAVAMEIPMVHKVDKEFFEDIKDGMTINLDATGGTVTVTA